MLNAWKKQNVIFFFNVLRHTLTDHTKPYAYTYSSFYHSRLYSIYVHRLSSCTHMYRSAKRMKRPPIAFCYETNCYVSRHGDTYSYRQLAFVLEPKPGGHFTHAFSNIIGPRGKQHYSLMRVLFECERQTFMFAQYIDDYWSFYASCNWRRLEVRWCPYV